MLFSLKQNMAARVVSLQEDARASALLPAAPCGPAHELSGLLAACKLSAEYIIMKEACVLYLFGWGLAKIRHVALCTCCNQPSCLRCIM